MHLDALPLRYYRKDYTEGELLKIVASIPGCVPAGDEPELQQFRVRDARQFNSSCDRRILWGLSAGAGVQALGLACAAGAGPRKRYNGFSNDRTPLLSDKGLSKPRILSINAQAHHVLA